MSRDNERHTMWAAGADAPFDPKREAEEVSLPVVDEDDPEYLQEAVRTSRSDTEMARTRERLEKTAELRLRAIQNRIKPESVEVPVVIEKIEIAFKHDPIKNKRVLDSGRTARVIFDSSMGKKVALRICPGVSTYLELKAKFDKEPDLARQIIEVTNRMIEDRNQKTQAQATSSEKSLAEQHLEQARDLKQRYAPKLDHYPDEVLASHIADGTIGTILNFASI